VPLFFTAAGSPLAYTIDANRSLTITLHEIYLAPAKTRSLARPVSRRPSSMPPTTPPPPP
jgi:hypothetical protein